MGEPDREEIRRLEVRVQDLEVELDRVREELAVAVRERDVALRHLTPPVAPRVWLVEDDGDVWDDWAAS
jgi:hypothetical protein